MRLKILFIVGLGVGYVLGARAGRPRYEQIRAKATEAWENPRVQKAVSETQGFVKENAPIVQEKMMTGTKAAVAGAQDVAVRTTEIAKDVSGKVAHTARDVSDSVAQSSKDASKLAKKASRKVAKTAKEASSNVSKTAKEVRDRIIDRGEEVVDGVIIAAGTARDAALDTDLDD